MDSTDHLFRHESGRIVAALTRIFGVQNLSLVEDVVQDAFYRAIQVWRFKGVPENPSAWLMKTAKNRAVDVLRRERHYRSFDPETEDLLHSEWTLTPFVAGAFEEHNIRDDELRVMFSCCHPKLPEAMQIALILNVCCGFSVGEIASAFLISVSSSEKRVARAKKVFISAERLFELEDARDITSRLYSVQRAIYLLFNEGYHGASSERSVRAELCEEAMRLGGLLAGHSLAATPSTFALCALMSFNAARLPGRIDSTGRLTSLFDQDRSRWNPRLISTGHEYLEKSATGQDVSDFHFEAAIASVHAKADSVETTDWGAIVSLYEMLLSMHTSPVIALNRAIAIAQLEGPDRGIEEISRIRELDRLSRYPFYFAALGELEARRRNFDIAVIHYQSAIAVARNPSEKGFLVHKISECLSNGQPRIQASPS